MAYEYYLGSAGSEYKLSRVDLLVEPDEEIIGVEQRLSGASAGLVRDVITRKKRWAFKFTRLPGQDSNVPDGGSGRDRLRSLYDTGGELRLWAPTENGIYDTYTVMFDMGSFIDRRVSVEPFWRWDVQFGLVEV